jgi:hypothetical protein
MEGLGYSVRKSCSVTNWTNFEKWEKTPKFFAVRFDVESLIEKKKHVKLLFCVFQCSPVHIVDCKT